MKNKNSNLSTIIVVAVVVLAVVFIVLLAIGSGGSNSDYTPTTEGRYVSTTEDSYVSPTDDFYDPTTADDYIPTTEADYDSTTEDSYASTSTYDSPSQTDNSSSDEGVLSRGSGWVKIECPLCDAGRDLSDCHICDGDGYYTNANIKCTKCKGQAGGKEYCYMCKNSFSLMIVEGSTTYSELRSKVQSLGDRPVNLYTCPSCGGDGCANCYGGIGIKFNNNYDVEAEAWDAELENILDGCIYEGSSSSGGSTGGSSTGSGSSSGGSTGGGSNDGDFVGVTKKTIEIDCFACLDGTETCSACGGSGRQMRATIIGDSDDAQWETCRKCNGSRTQPCSRCNGMETVTQQTW